jgi:hypothetical protein
MTVLLRRAVDRLTLVVLGTAIVLLLAWLLFHPLVVAALQGALVIVAAAWRVRLVRRAS